MFLNKNQKKEKVIKLYEEGKTTREIAKEVRISLRDSGIIKQEYENREYENEPEPEPVKSLYARALEMFSQEKSPVGVSIALDLPFETIKKYYNEYFILNNMSNFVNILVNHTNFLPFFIHIGENMKMNGLFKEYVNTLIRYLYDLDELSKKRMELTNDVNCLVLKKSNIRYN